MSKVSYTACREAYGDSPYFRTYPSHPPCPLPGDLRGDCAGHRLSGLPVGRVLLFAEARSAAEAVEVRRPGGLGGRMMWAGGIAVAVVADTAIRRERTGCWSRIQLAEPSFAAVAAAVGGIAGASTLPAAVVAPGAPFVVACTLLVVAVAAAEPSFARGRARLVSEGTDQART